MRPYPGYFNDSDGLGSQKGALVDKIKSFSKQSGLRFSIRDDIHGEPATDTQG